MGHSCALTASAFIDWDGWLWDRDKNGRVFIVSKDAETWLAGYEAALKEAPNAHD